MPRATKPPVDPDDAPLKRLGGGRWQTRDERFTIEPQSGTWVVVDAEQTDDFGLALVRGPYPSLPAAKEAISGARASEPATSPLVERNERRRGAPPRESQPAPGGAKAAKAGKAPKAAEAPPKTAEAPPKPASKVAAKSATEEPREPGWLTDLDGAERGRARRLIEWLAEDGATDAEGLVRRDVVGDVPALAAHAIARRLAELGDDASPDEVATLLADGRDERLGVRWRLVDGGGRPILLESARRRR
jgi:hypothetical protein